MNWNIPLFSGQTLPITLEAGDRLIIVGANGSGKSALIQHLVSSNPSQNIQRMTAHRQTWLPTGSINLSPEQRKQFERNNEGSEANNSARWIDRNSQGKQAAVLFDLVSKDNARARSVTRFVDEDDFEGAKYAASKAPSLFVQINELLALGTLSVRLENSEGEEIIAHHQGSTTSFSIAQMSDGERNAAIMAATVLTLEAGKVLLIDAPERHLHRSVIVPFLSALFDHRKDCSFVISTHETALPVADSEARVVIVRGCTWDEDIAQAWDLSVLEAGADLPEELKLAILGSRRRVLFVEGCSSSLDLPLYHALFPDISVVAKGPSTDVQRAVAGLRASSKVHHVDPYGLIDGDGRSDDERIRLAEQHVFALSMYSVESLYYCSDAIAAVAGRQAEFLNKSKEEMTRLAKSAALIALRENGLDERMAARRCQLSVRDLMLAQLPDWQTIRDNTSATFNASVVSPFLSALANFKQLLDEENLDDLVARYPIRDSGVFKAIATALELTSRNTCQRMLVSCIKRDEELVPRPAIFDKYKN